MENLPYISPKALRELFEQAGPVKDIRWPEYNGRRKRFAYIEMETEAGATAALSKNHSFVKGRPIRVSRSRPRLKAAPPPKKRETVAERRARRGQRVAVPMLPRSIALATDASATAAAPPPSAPTSMDTE